MWHVICRASKAVILCLGAAALFALALFKSGSPTPCKDSSDLSQQGKGDIESPTEHKCNKNCIFTKAGKCATSWSSSMFTVCQDLDDLTIAQHHQIFDIRHRLLHRLQTIVKTVKACENKIEIARERRTAADKMFDEAYNASADLGCILKERQAYQAALGLPKEEVLKQHGNATEAMVDDDILRAEKTMEMAEREMHKADTLREAALGQLRYAIQKI